MRRLTARLLLIFSLVGILAPIAMAVSGPAPHACCLRTEHGGCHHSRKTESLTIRAIDKGGCRTCCPPNVTAQWAELRRTHENLSTTIAAPAPLRTETAPRTSDLYPILPARAPPSC